MARKYKVHTISFPEYVYEAIKTKKAELGRLGSINAFAVEIVAKATDAKPPISDDSVEVINAIGEIKVRKKTHGKRKAS